MSQDTSSDPALISPQRVNTSPSRRPANLAVRKLGGQDHGIALFERQVRTIASHVDFSTAELRLEIEELDQSVFVEKGNVPWERIAYPGDARNDLKLLLPGMLLGASALQSSNL